MLQFAIYVLSILLVNIGFIYVPMIPTALGMFSPMAVVVGVTFVLRDYAQRAVGHNVLLGIPIGAALTWAFAGPEIAIASVIAFVTSELVDWALYTWTKKPFYQRVWISSLLSTPVDTLVFLFMIDRFSWGTAFLMILSKLVAAMVIWGWGKNRDIKRIGADEPRNWEKTGYER